MYNYNPIFMTKKNTFVPKSTQQISGNTIQRMIDQIGQHSETVSNTLNSKIKKTYLNPRIGV